MVFAAAYIPLKCPIRFWLVWLASRFDMQGSADVQIRIPVDTGFLEGYRAVLQTYKT